MVTSRRELLVGGVALLSGCNLPSQSGNTTSSSQETTSSANSKQVSLGEEFEAAGETIVFSDISYSRYVRTAESSISGNSDSHFINVILNFPDRESGGTDCRFNGDTFAVIELDGNEYGIEFPCTFEIGSFSPTRQRTSFKLPLEGCPETGNVRWKKNIKTPLKCAIPKAVLDSICFPPRFELSDLIVPQEVSRGEFWELEAKIKNTGESRGKFQCIFQQPGGERTYHDATILPGKQTSISEHIQVGDTGGDTAEYIVSWPEGREKVVVDVAD